MSAATLIEVELLSGRYHAHVWGESQFGMGGPEWPPSPWRLLRALASAWFCAQPRLSSDSDRDRLLESLGRTDSPELWLPPASVQELRYYQPVRLGASDRVLHHDHFAVPEGGRFWFRFGVGLDDAQRALLDSLLARIRYFGRTESRALLRLRDDGERPPGTYRIVARGGVTSGSDTVFRRVLGTDTTFSAEHLWRAAGEAADGARAGQPSHLVDTLLSRKMPLPRGARWIEYAVPVAALVHEIRQPTRAPEPATCVNVNVGEIHFQLSRRIPIPLRLLIAVSRAFRDAAVSVHHRISNGLHSRTLTGREADNSVARGHDHAYYMPCLDTGAPTIGRLVVRVPTGTLTRAEYDTLLAVHRIRVGGRAYPITVVFDGALPARAAPDESSKAVRWRSATPFLPPHHRHRGRDTTTPEEQVATCVERTCGMRPQIVRLVPGRAGLTSITSLLAHEYIRGTTGENGRPWKLTRHLGFWLELEFSKPVALNASMGVDAHFGAGQFAPILDLSGGG